MMKFNTLSCSFYTFQSKYTNFLCEFRRSRRSGGHGPGSANSYNVVKYFIKIYTTTSQESKIWLTEDDEPPTVLKVQKTLGKVLYAVFFRSTGLVKAVKLEGQKSVTAKWYTEVCLPEVLSYLNVRGLMLHLDNASSDTASLTQNFLDDNRVKTVPHPPYSPLCDFWVYDCDKILSELSHNVNKLF